MECLVERVLTPSTYYVTKKEDKPKLKKIELIIKDEIKSGSLRAGVKNEDKFVAAALDDEKKFCRGEILEWGDNSCKIFLLDYGRDVNVENSKLYPLPKTVIEDVAPFAFKICLFGLFPKTKVKTENGEFKEKITDTWPEGSIEHFISFFKKFPDIIIDDMKTIKDVTFCSILINDDGFVPLKKYLEYRFSTFYHEDVFKRRVMGIEDPASVKSEKSTNYSTSGSSSGTWSLSLSEDCSQKKSDKVPPSGEREDSIEEAKRKGSKARKILLEFMSKGSKSPGKENIEESNSNVPRAERKAKLPSPVKFDKGYFSEGQNKENSYEMDNSSNQDEVLEDQMSIRSDSKSNQKSIFEELLREDRAKPKTSTTFQIVPAGKLRKGEEKPKKQQNRRSLNSSNQSGGSVHSDKDLKSENSSYRGGSVYSDKDRKSDQGSLRGGRERGPFQSSRERDSFQGRRERSSFQGERERDSCQDSRRKVSQDFREKGLERSGKELSAVRTPRASSVIDAPSTSRTSQQITSSRTYSLSSFSLSSGRTGRLETVKLSEEHVIAEGVHCETISSHHTFITPLVLCSDAEVLPERRFLDLKLLPDIVSNLKANKYEELKGVQKWAIPAISRNSNTVIISSRRGKTISYVVPLIDFVQDKTNFEELPDGNGPYVVILCSSSKHVHKVYEYCHMLLGNDLKRKRFRSSIQVQYAYGGGAEQEKWVDLTNGCHILITTPHCLNRLLEHFVITNLERLCCLVIEDAEIVTEEPYKDELLNIFKAANTAVKNRSYQKILCSGRWTPAIATFVQSIEKNHVLIFGTHLEAAVYAKLKPHLWFVVKEKKPQALVEKLKDKFKEQKILIVSENAQEIVKLAAVIKKECGNVKTLIAHEGILATDIKEISAEWKSSSKSVVLLCTDDTLRELRIDDAQTLVHYSLPYKWKTNFGNRFSCLMKNYRRYYASSKEENEKDEKDVSVYILVDDENHYQLPHIVEFAQRLGAHITNKVVQKCEEIKIQIELAKGKLPICTKILEFGKCAHQQSCTQRHAFNKAIDEPKNLPTSGAIVFSVLKIHDACRFSARILEHYDDKNNKINFSNDYIKICMKLTKYYKTEENRRPHGLPKLGDVCAIFDEEKKVFHRAQVVEYAKVDEHNQPLEVSVRLMDRGDILTRPNLELYEVSEELSSFRPQAVDIILCGVLPTDFDSNWGVPACQLSEKLLMEKETNEHEKWFGRIVLALNNTLCLDPIQFCEFLPEVKTQISKFSLKDKLLHEKFAVPNKNHLKLLYGLCEKAGIKVPKYELSKPSVVEVKASWAFFHQDFIKCRFLSALNSSVVFFQNEKFVDLLNKLEADSTMEARKIIRRNGHRNFEIIPGKFCLARYGDDKETETFNRARIEGKIEGPGVEEDLFKVFFVDYGDYGVLPRKDIVPISDKFITQLPFQAIECSLVGIKHEEKPTEQLMEEIYSFSRDGADLVYVSVIKNDLKPSYTDGRKYQINLLSLKGASLNKQLIEKKLVTPIDSEKGDADDIEIEDSDDEKDENENEEEEEELDWDAIKAEREKRKEEELKNAEPEIVEVNNRNNNNTINNNNDDAKEKTAKSTSSESVSSEFDEKIKQGLTAEEIEALLDEDEEANLFFQTLATQHFGEGKVAKEIFKCKSVSDTSSNGSRSDKSNARSTAVQKPPSSRVAKLLLSLNKKPGAQNVKPPPRVILPEGVFTPEVRWIQGSAEVCMMIMLTDVKDYRFEISPNSLIFCCSLDGKLYALELRLFGTINPELTEIEVKARQVDVVLKKLCSDLWPRLVLDKMKHPNIHFDVDKVQDHNESYIDYLMNKTNEQLSRGKQVKPLKNYGKVAPVDWDENDEYYEDSDDYTGDDESNDPYDFLAD